MSQLDEEYVTETYYPSPQKSFKGFFREGKLISASVWRPDGQLCLETNLLEGFGKVVRYKKDGSRWFETFYQNGHKHGTEIKYHVNGQKWIETPWQNGKKHGVQIEYDEDGSPLLETPWLTGEKHGNSFWFGANGSKSLYHVWENNKRITPFW